MLANHLTWAVVWLPMPILVLLSLWRYLKTPS